MAKKDEIILIIAKSFSKMSLTPEEIEACCDLSQITLVKDHGLNDVQSKEVMNWCSLQKRKRIGYTNEINFKD